MFPYLSGDRSKQFSSYFSEFPLYCPKPAHDIWVLQAALNVMLYPLLTDGVPFVDLFIVLV